MATINKAEILSAFERLGELAACEGERIELLLVGGGVMVLAFDERPATRDVDVVILSPPDRAMVRRLAEIVGGERNWPADWLNEGAKAFVVDPSPGATLLAYPGLEVRMPFIEQLLAMKLCAWRDDVDISDARRLLRELSGDRDPVWNRVKMYLLPGRETKAKFAYEDLWEEVYGSA